MLFFLGFLLRPNDISFYESDLFWEAGPTSAIFGLLV